MARNDEKSWFADAEAYERYIGRWSRPIAAGFLDWLARPSGLRWVDAGRGTGALGAAILERCAPRAVAGVEPSEGFLGVARATIEDDRASFQPGDARALPLDDDRARLRAHLEDALPTGSDGAISLSARGWAVRGTR